MHWNWRMTAMRFTVVCCNSIVFLKSVSEDRNGMAAPTCLDRYLVSSSVLADRIGTAYIMNAI